jgi:hypothetical protein
VKQIEFAFGGAPCAGQSKKTLQKKRTSDLRTSLAKVAARTQRLIGAKPIADCYPGDRVNSWCRERLKFGFAL